MIPISTRFKNFFYRNICVFGDESVFYSHAKVINCLNDKHKIRIGHHCHIRGEILVFGHGGDVSIGDYCYVGANTYIWSAKRIKIGDRVLISHNCNIFDSDTHPMDPEVRHWQFKEIITRGQPKQIDLKEKDTFIEDDVLIAANSTILKGVTIGAGAVVGAGSVVTRNVPPMTVVAGNPAKVVRVLRGDKD